MRYRRGRHLMVAAALAGLGACARERPAEAVQASAYDSRFTLEKDDGGTLPGIDRATSPEVYFRVTLSDAPVGRRLRLTCAWLDPQGSVAAENAWETKTIDRATWPTHCRHRFGPAAAAGTWKVSMAIGGQTLATTSLEVR